MKAPWFPFYTGDFLASPDVQLMEAHEVGAYLLLLANSWQSDTPGYLPNEEGRLRRVCRLSAEAWKESSTLLLSKWPVAENGLRCNKRLLHEANQQAARRERLAANGAKGGRPVQNQKDSKKKATDNLQVPDNNLEVIETEPTGLLSSSQPQSTNVDEKASAPAKPEPVKSLTPAQHAERRAAENDEQLFNADNWPGLVNATTFAGICADLRLPIDLDRESYRAAIQDKLRQKQVEAPAPTLRSWINTFFLTEKKKGPLLTIQAGIPTEPTPKNRYAEINNAGGVIAIEAVSGDQNMTRMKITSLQQHFPKATIHAIQPR